MAKPDEYKRPNNKGQENEKRYTTKNDYRAKLNSNSSTESTRRNQDLGNQISAVDGSSNSGVDQRSSINDSSKPQQNIYNIFIIKNILNIFIYSSKFFTITVSSAWVDI